MLASTLTSKGQTTIPAEVRKALNLHPGDILTFKVTDHQAVVTKAEPFDYLYHRALSYTLSEWESAADDEAYNDL
jgi:antitoxin PrlF